MATDLKNGEPGVASLVGGIVSDAQELMRQQFVLLKREVQQELRQAKSAAFSLGIGGGILAVGGLLLVLMLVYLLFEYTGLPLWGCYAIVGAAFAATGGIMLYSGKEQAADVHLAPPPQTAEAMKENLQWLKAQTTSDGK